MLREYLVSEAMHALGVPTTRALAVVATRRGDPGDPAARGGPHPGGVEPPARGHFQFAGPGAETALEVVRGLADHAIARHLPAAAGADGRTLPSSGRVAAQARLIAPWMLVGFIHGVMDPTTRRSPARRSTTAPAPSWTRSTRRRFCSIDPAGRYAFGHQPPVAGWNLARLAESLLPLFADDEEEAIAPRRGVARAATAPTTTTAWLHRLAAKLGLPTALGEEDRSGRWSTTCSCSCSRATGVDLTSFFRALGRHRPW